MEVIFAIFPLFFIAVFGVMIFILVKAFQQSQEYKKHPIVTVFAKVLDKRMVVRNDYSYDYATFELDSGDRHELRLPRESAGLIIENDQGQLTFQGDKFISFERNDDMY